eukprot:413896_1
MLLLLFSVTAIIYHAESTSASICSSSDPVAECNALIDFANNLNYKDWKENSDWMSDKSICDWYGIECSSGHVKEIQMKSNKLSGSIVSSIGNLTELKELNIEG